MNISQLNIGVIHSLIGKNDGVSIVIDQSVLAMVKYLKIPLGNIYFLAAHSSPRYNTHIDEVFWHKSELHQKIIRYFCEEPPDSIEQEILDGANHAKKVIRDFVKHNNIDLLIAHNISHPYNFVTALGLNFYIDERRQKGYLNPRLVTWWHDSFYERSKFHAPNPLMQRYLRYLPGTYADGLIFINHNQVKLGKKYYHTYAKDRKYADFFRYHSAVIPNTCEINWAWKKQNWNSDTLIFPPPDSYNQSFFHDIGLLEQLEHNNFTLNDAVILLQHTRVVPRKKIETAIDLAYALSKKFGQKKCVVLIVSGHSGDEQQQYKDFLIQYQQEKSMALPDANVIFIFGENRILSHRDIIVDHKYYKFSEIPAAVAAAGGMGTYFSDVEGYGNNLLEMVAAGLPVILNRYEIYRKEIEPLGFNLPYVDQGILSDDVVDAAFKVLTDRKARNQMVQHNLKVLEKKLNPQIMTRKIHSLVENIFFRK